MPAVIRFPIESLRAVEPRRPEGYLDAVLSAGRVVADGTAVELTTEAYNELAARFSPGRKPVASLRHTLQPRCGTELHALLRDWLRIEPTPDCQCRAMQARMDTLGPDWCEGDGMPEILGVMREEHAKRWADGRTLLPWNDIAARQLVLLACRRARAKALA